jgi:hypothetical protein
VEPDRSTAGRFTAGLAAGGLEIADDVVLNQVIVGFGTDDRTTPCSRCAV